MWSVSRTLAKTTLTVIAVKMFDQTWFNSSLCICNSYYPPPPATEVDWGRECVCNPEQAVPLWFWHTLSYGAPFHPSSKWRNQSETHFYSLMDGCFGVLTHFTYVLPFLLSLSFQGCGLWASVLFLAQSPSLCAPTARVMKIPPKGGLCQHHQRSQFVQCCSKLNSSRCSFSQYYISSWSCFQYGHIIDSWYKGEDNPLTAVCPTYLVDLIHNFFWFPKEREKNNWKLDTHWNAVLEPLQPIKLLI